MNDDNAAGLDRYTCTTCLTEYRLPPGHCHACRSNEFIHTKLSYCRNGIVVAATLTYAEQGYRVAALVAEDFRDVIDVAYDTDEGDGVA